MEEIKYHLNWDATQNNGIIFNDTYTWGAFFEGAELKPSLSFNYHEFEYSEVFENPNWVKISEGDDKTPMSEEQELEIRAKAIVWVQELGTEGNLTEEQLSEQEATLTDEERITLIFNMTEEERDVELHNLAIKYDLAFTEIVEYYDSKVIEYGLV